VKQLVRDFFPSFFTARLSISFRYIHILFIVAMIPSTFLEKASTQNPGILMQWVFIKALGLIATFVIWWIGKNLFTRISIQTTFFWTGALGAIGAALGACLVSKTALIFELSDPTTIQKRAAGAFVIGGLWLPFYAFAIENFERYRDLEYELLADLDKQEQIRFKQSTFFYLLRSKAQESIQERLRVTALESQLLLQRYIDEGKDEAHLPDVVREFASGAFRNFSHDLLERSQSLQGSQAFLKSRTTRGRIRSYVSLATLGGKSVVLDPTIFAFVTGFFTLGILIRHQSFLGTFLVALINFSASFAILKLAGLLFGRTVRLKVLVNQLSVFALMFLPSFFAHLLTRINALDLFRNGFTRYFWLYATLVGATAIGLNIVQSALISSREMRNSLKRAVHSQATEEAVISREIINISQNWAKHIHGKLQSNLIVQAKLLQNAQEQSDAQGIESAINEILGILRNPGLEVESDPTTLSAELTKRKELWSPLAQVSINQQVLDHNIRTSEKKAISDCVEELIANAIRHGRASKVEIYVAKEGERTIMVSATDDGEGFSENQPGLGFHLFDYLSGGAWYTEKSDSTGLTTVKIAIDSSILVDEESPGSPRQ